MASASATTQVSAVETTKTPYKPLARRSSLERIKDLKTYLCRRWRPSVLGRTEVARLSLVVLRAVATLRATYLTLENLVLAILAFLTIQCVACVLAVTLCAPPAGFWFLCTCLAIISSTIAGMLIPEKNDKFWIKFNKFF